MNKPDITILPSVEDIETAAERVMDMALADAKGLMERLDCSDCARAFLQAAIDTRNEKGGRSVGIIVVRAYLQGILAERGRNERMQHTVAEMEHLL